jgi:MFS transporter, DHA1 family, tetracycline resistance protein
MRARSPIGLPRGPLAIVMLTVFIDLLGFGIVLPLLPLWAEDFGASPLMIGLITASYALMQFIFAPIWGAVSDRHGRRPVILVTLLGSAVGAALLGFAWALWVILLARVLHGIAGASYGVAQAYVADLTAPEQRARGMGLIGVAFGLGFIAGPAIGAVFVVVHERLPFFVASALALVNLALAARWLPESLPARVAVRVPRFRALRRALTGPRLAPLIWLTLVATFAFVGMEATFALFTERRLDFGQGEVAWAFAYVGVLTAVAQGLLVGRVVARHGERRVLLAGLVLTAIGLLALALAFNVVALLIALVPLAAGSGLVFATTTSLISRQADAAEQGSILGVTASVGGLARIAGPPVATGLFQFVGIAAPLLLGAALFAGCAAFAAAAVVRPPAVPRVPVGGHVRDA